MGPSKGGGAVQRQTRQATTLAGSARRPLAAAPLPLACPAISCHLPWPGGLSLPLPPPAHLPLPLGVAGKEGKVVQDDGGGDGDVERGGAGAVLRDVHERVAQRQLPLVQALALQRMRQEAVPGWVAAARLRAGGGRHSRGQQLAGGRRGQPGKGRTCTTAAPCCSVVPVVQESSPRCPA